MREPPQIHMPSLAERLNDHVLPLLDSYDRVGLLNVVKRLKWCEGQIAKTAKRPQQETRPARQPGIERRSK